MDAAKEFLLPQLQVNAMFHVKHKKNVVAIAGGRAPDANWLRQAAGASEVYCADKGIKICRAAGLKPVCLLGDGDSAGSEAYCQAEKAGVLVRRFPVAKDDTDLQLLLKELPKQSDLLISGVWGGRFDHLYANIFSLLGWQKKTQAQVLLADEKEVMLLCPAGSKMRVRLTDCRLARSLSVLPLSDECTVSLSGARWPLERQRLTQLYPYAVSNIPRQEVIFSCHSGDAGLYFCFDEKI